MNKKHEVENRSLKPSQIKVDESYQRSLKEWKVARIVKEFNPDIMNEPKVSLRSDGAYYVFDGQHTVCAWEKMYGDRPIKCKVFRGLTWQEEKDLFLNQNGISSPPTTGDKLRAELNGGNVEVEEMVLAANEAGFEVHFEKTGAYNWKIVAVAALFKAYKKAGLVGLTEILQIIADTWDGEQKSVTAGFISGMTAFYLRYKGEYNKGELVSRLSAYSPSWFIREARDLNGSNEERFCNLFLRVYNNRKRNKIGMSGRRVNRYDTI